MNRRLMFSVSDSDTPFGCTSTHLNTFITQSIARLSLNEQLYESFFSSIDHILHFLKQGLCLFSFADFCMIILGYLFVIFADCTVESLFIPFFQEVQSFSWICQKLRFNKIPILDEMPKKIKHHISSKLQCDIMPRHPHL